MKDVPRPKEAPEPLPKAILAAIQEAPWSHLEMRPLANDADWPRGMAYRVRYELPDLGIDSYTEYFARDYLPRGIDRGRFLEGTQHYRAVERLVKEVHRFPYGFYFQGTPGCWEAFAAGFPTRMMMIVAEWGRINGDVNGKRAAIAQTLAEFVKKKAASP